MSKNRVAALGASAVSAALVGTALFAPAATAAEAPVSPSAYAISASGIINIPKTPYAEGTSDPDAVVSIPGQPLLNVDVLDAMSEPGKAKAKVAGVSLLAGSIKTGIITASCTNGELNSDIASLTLFGNEVPIDVAANQVDIPAPLEGLVDIQINKQATNDDGSKTVTAVSIQLLKGVDAVVPAEKMPAVGPVLDKLTGQTINLASATCAKTDDGDGDNPGDGDNGDGDNGDDNPGDGDNGNGDNNGGGNGDNGGADEADEDGTAPTPVPQPGHISVTG